MSVDGTAHTARDIVLATGSAPAPDCGRSATSPGIWPFTHVGKYQGRVTASNILGEPREADYSAVPRVVFTDPQAAAVGEADGPVTVTVPLADVARTATYTRTYDSEPGFMTLVSDGGSPARTPSVPRPGSGFSRRPWPSARVPLEVMHDVIQPFPTFSEAFLHALLTLRAAAAPTTARVR